MKNIFIIILVAGLFSFAGAEEINYSDSWGAQGLSLISQSKNKVVVNFSIETLHIETKNVNGSLEKQIIIPDVFLPGEEGAPDLPSVSRFIAVPEGASASLSVMSFRQEVIDDIDIAPAPRIPWDTERGPLEYNKNPDIYSKNAFYPEQPFKISNITEIRGVDAIILGITPFQYNPVTKQLIIYRDVKVEITFNGGNGHFGDDRLRSRWWEPLLRDAFLNEQSIPGIKTSPTTYGSDETGCEYLIIVPNGNEYMQWADSLKSFRTKQGILTKIVTLNEIGGNNVNTIESYINNAYNHWDIPPAACLIMADYGTNPDNRIIAPIWDNYCASDNIYGDVNGNNLPDIVMARMTARNAEELETMVTKVIHYEKAPPVSQYYYDHPITALGFQTERWFQICSESVAGFWENELGKTPVRINKTYQGNPLSDPWSTASNTYTVLNVFGPNGLSYIPSSPGQVNCSWNGNAGDVSGAINSGAFMLQHRDHGSEGGWGEPSFHSSNINSLTNTDLTFIWSVNCLTGKYNLSGDCFAEKFHKHKYNGVNSGCNGIVAASEVSYSFVNDTYVWGAYDNMWPGFLPQYGTNPDYRGVLPAFANAAGKIFLWQSNWPSNPNNKEVTVNLFHLHGDAFMTVYSEMPGQLTVLYNEVLLEGAGHFTVTADTFALIGLTVDGDLIASAVSTGEQMDIAIPSLPQGTQVLLTVTKQNFFRYEHTINVIEANIPYVVHKSHSINDISGNNNGLLDYGESVSMSLEMENLGMLQAGNVSVTVSCNSEFIEFTDSTEVFGDIPSQGSVAVEDAVSFNVSNVIPDAEEIIFNVEATDGNSVWNSQFILKAHAPVLEFADFTVTETAGNGNGRIDPGETAEITVSIKNSGSSVATDVEGELVPESDSVQVSVAVQSFGTISPGETIQNTYSVTVSPEMIEGKQAIFDLNISADLDVQGYGTFFFVVGRYTALIIDLDNKQYSGPSIYETFNQMDIYSEYTTDFPEDLSLYKNLFVCLGIINTNHELTQNEGAKLKQFLLNGGNIYMEGRLAWSEDPQTPVHPLFNIESQEVGWFLIDTVRGYNSTFTGGTAFEYDGHTPISKYTILPQDNSFALFETNDSSYVCGVANDAGNYKTIGTIFEFGELIDTGTPSTKAWLMQAILDWFDGLITNTEFIELNGTGVTLSVNPNPFTKSTGIYFYLPKGGNVTVDIYNVNGKKIKTLVSDKFYNKGRNSLSWDVSDNEGKRVSPGIYFGYLKTAEKRKVVKMLVK